jgi:hypothetical protein
MVWVRLPSREVKFPLGVFVAKHLSSTGAGLGLLGELLPVTLSVPFKFFHYYVLGGLEILFPTYYYIGMQSAHVVFTSTLSVLMLPSPLLQEFEYTGTLCVLHAGVCRRCSPSIVTSTTAPS